MNLKLNVVYNLLPICGDALKQALNSTGNFVPPRLFSCGFFFSTFLDGAGVNILAPVPQK